MNFKRQVKSREISNDQIAVSTMQRVKVGGYERE